MSQSILQFLRDPIWQFILGVMGIIISVAISIYIYKKQKPRKQITCRVVSVVPLFNLKENFQGKLQVFFENQNIENIFIATIRIYNSGNTPIETSDYELPITLNIGTNKLLTAEVLETNPPKIPASVKINDNGIEVSPVLLNPNDALMIKAVMDQYYERVNVNTRIVGMKQLQLLVPEQFEKNVLRDEHLVNLIVYLSAVVTITTTVLSLLSFFVK